MDTKNTGGPAFPKAGLDPWNTAQSVQTGMTLRDYFAAKAMQGMLACFKDYDGATEMQGRVRKAYEIADAMLAEREKAGK